MVTYRKPNRGPAASLEVVEYPMVVRISHRQEGH